MRHLRKSRRFGRQPAHRKAMFKNLVTSLFLHERVLTTVEKAKELRRVAEKLVTLGKRGGVDARRLAARKLTLQGRHEGARQILEETALKKLFEVFASRYSNRPGGYTRIIRYGRRRGDNAPMAFIEMMPEELKTPAPKKGAKKTTAAPTKEKGRPAVGKKTASKTSAASAKKGPAKKATTKASPSAKSKSAKTSTKDDETKGS